MGINIIIGYILMFIGAFFFLLSAIGLLRLPDLYTRMQAATKSTTLGAISSIIGIGLMREDILIKSIILATFILLTAPISGSALIRAGYKAKSPMTDKTVVDKFKEKEGE
ncbi:monovalent cation/H(+) antiporter subunit G [Caldisericum exile]|uniref:Na(+)/H(+) antiporter subunit G n=1 Tax=Caldisericum exile (strain DSM 21853 / NBRC 104410 / AZM16c01) TaxID=511051 RepID=A0A7U6GDY5_CALEA|nr:monovalent cation/H(+) antiporter subunit G [Caldisericum exile]BAL80532.1 Na(+)/H(+) antiporter subunit G [Caldisericum exile AZM16c01]